MSSITPSRLERLLFVCAVAATIHGAARAAPDWAALNEQARRESFVSGRSTNPRSQNDTN